jgi:hypothetical protein
MAASMRAKPAAHIVIFACQHLTAMAARNGSNLSLATGGDR